MKDRRALYFMIVPIILAAAMGAAEAAPVPAAPPGPSAEALRAHVKFLASPALKGRLTGSPEIQRAADYIVAEYKKYGLLPAGDKGGYFQEFPFVAGTYPGKNNRLEFTVDGKMRSFRPGEEFLPMLFSGVGSVEAAVVFAGYGISAPELEYDDYEGLDVKDKAVLVLRLSPDGDDPDSPFAPYDRLQDKAITAREKGARAILFVSGPLHKPGEKLEAPRAQGMVAALGILSLQLSQSTADRLLAPSGKTLQELQENLQKEQKPASFAVKERTVSLTVDLFQERKTCRNVVAYLPPADGVERGTLVVGAHYDHIGLGGDASRAEKKYGDVHPGADDNASGSAAVLELARLFAAKRDTLRRGIVFIHFSGEELGLLGSSWYVEHPFKPVKETTAMLNLDMVGRLRDDTLIVNGADTSPQWEAMLDAVNEGFQFDLRRNQGGFSAGDNTSFYKEDLPVLFLFTNVHDDYHMPADTWDKIHYEGEARVVGFAAGLLDRLQALDGPLAFSKSKASAGGQRGAMRVYTGTIPDFAAETEGYKLAGTQPDSPAEKAGLKKGDIITGVGTMAVKNIYDYMAAFKGFKPGDTVEMRYLRDGKEGKVVVVLAPSKRSDK
jgi:hypothetical protein